MKQFFVRAINIQFPSCISGTQVISASNGPELLEAIYEHYGIRANQNVEIQVWSRYYGGLRLDTMSEFPNECENAFLKCVAKLSNYAD